VGGEREGAQRWSPHGSEKGLGLRLDSDKAREGGGGGAGPVET
jgi:hypothetical protein